VAFNLFLDQWPGVRILNGPRKRVIVAGTSCDGKFDVEEREERIYEAFSGVCDCFGNRPAFQCCALLMEMHRVRAGAKPGPLLCITLRQPYKWIVTHIQPQRADNVAEVLLIIQYIIPVTFA
jgi:hypothetical protein